MEGEKKDQEVANTQEIEKSTRIFCRKERNVIKTQKTHKKRRKRPDHQGQKL